VIFFYLDVVALLRFCQAISSLVLVDHWLCLF
jgi:hypothetical protein